MRICSLKVLSGVQLLNRLVNGFGAELRTGLLSGRLFFCCESLAMSCSRRFSLLALDIFIGRGVGECFDF